MTTILQQKVELERAAEAFEALGRFYRSRAAALVAPATAPPPATALNPHPMMPPPPLESVASSAPPSRRPAWRIRRLTPEEESRWAWENRSVSWVGEGPDDMMVFGNCREAVESQIRAQGGDFEIA